MTAASIITTLLFSDIEGSARLWEQNRERMAVTLAAHDAAARKAVESNHGWVVKMTGDGMFAAFVDPTDALEAALDLQRAMSDAATGGSGVPLRVRCGLHAGGVERRDNDLFGPAVNRAARIMAAAHGGQVLVSQAVVNCVGAILPAAVSLRDLGKVRLKDLATPEHVYQVEHPDLRREFPALRSLETTPNNLPQQLTSFIGREHELSEVRKLLGKSRLVTLLGVGGLGKTRLSLQAGAEALEEYPDGVWFVELAPVADGGRVAQAVASVLGVKEEAGQPVAEALLKFVQDRQLLLVLDNCEHLAHACAELARDLLQSGPQTKILASSREPLHIAGEATYQLPALSFPDPRNRPALLALTQYEAVRLFVDRAVAAQPAFQVTDQNAFSVASICHRLDGIPLAIELAAARVRSLAVRLIDERLTDRFRLLTSGDRTALPRQQALRACIDWSYDLLNAPETLLLQRLSVFAGGWTLAAAEQVCAGGEVKDEDVLDLMTSLHDKSLVVAELSDGRSRYRLLETVRQYAGEKLVESGGAEKVRERQRDHFLALAEEAETKLLGDEQVEWLRHLEEEHDNLMAALEWSQREAEPRGGLRLCGALQRFWFTRGNLAEGREWCRRILEVHRSKEPTAERAKALNAAGLLAYHQGDYSSARAGLEETLAIRRQLGDARSIAVALGNLGMVALDQSDFASAQALHQESLAISRELGNRNGVARSLGNLGMLAFDQRDLAAARALFEECLALMRDLGDRDGIAICLHNLGGVAFEQRDFAFARTLHAESLVILRELDHRGRIVYSIEELAGVVAVLGDPLRAARLWGAAERLREEMGSPIAEPSRDPPRIAAARAASADDEAFNCAWQAGRAMTLEQAMQAALMDSERAA